MVVNTFFSVFISSRQRPVPRATQDSGSSAKVNLALDGVPEFTAKPGIGPHLMGDIAVAPSIDYLERASFRFDRWYARTCNTL